MALLEVNNLTVGYMTKNGLLKAVDSLSFSLEEGKSLGFVGESGCGKTTIGMALMGLLPSNGSVLSGSIRFEGGELADMDEAFMKKIRWNKISMIFQAAMNAMNPVHRVSEQIVEAILYHRPHISKQEAMERVKYLFKLVGIPEKRMRDFPHQYSGGMKQRAVIAMALACRPKLIIADEPTTALDVIIQHQILEEMKELQRELNISVIFISHDISIVADVCHYIGVMYAGQLVEYGTREEVFDNPMHYYTRALLSSYPTLEGEKKDLVPIPGEAPNLTETQMSCRFCDRCEGAGGECKIGPPEWAELTTTHRVLCGRCLG